MVVERTGRQAHDVPAQYFSWPAPQSAQPVSSAPPWHGVFCTGGFGSAWHRHCLTPSPKSRQYETWLNRLHVAIRASVWQSPSEAQLLKLPGWPACCACACG